MNELSSQTALVVIGGSAGAFDPLRLLLAALPARDCPPVVVLIHIPPKGPSLLHEVLSCCSVLPMKEAEDKERLAAGTIYFAPPGYHLLIEPDGSLSLSADAPVHYSRPSIDVLFESAAYAYGDRTLAVLLSGASADGADGMALIVQFGGTALVQDPGSAQVAFMPESALAACPQAHALTPLDLAARLSRLHAPAIV